jgi:hypothetical protein
VQLDEVLGLAARAVDRLLEMLGRAFERGDDIARIEAPGGGLDTSHDAARFGPAFGGVADLDPGPALLLFTLGAGHAEIVGDDADLGIQHVVPGEPEDVIDAVLLAQSHGLGAGLVAVAAPTQPRPRPVAADAADDMPDDGTASDPPGVLPSRRITTTGLPEPAS